MTFLCNTKRSVLVQFYFICATCETKKYSANFQNILGSLTYFSNADNMKNVKTYFKQMRDLNK